MLGKRLKYGDTIGVVSPAGPETKEFIEAQIELLKNKGFKVKEGKHLYDRNGFLAGDDKDRAEDLLSMFLDEEVSAIICFRGGYGTMRILPLLDFDIIRKNPKIFVGYSDITTLLNYISQNCDIVTFHGPMINSDLQDKTTFYSLMQSIMFGYKPYVISNPPNTPLSFRNVHSRISGTIVGGNLTLLSSTIGSKYEIDMKDKILFIEEIGEEPYKVDRMLTQLLLCNKLQDCKAFILGQFTDCDATNYERSLSLNQVIEDRLLSLNKPTVFNFMSGHDYPKLTLPIGAKITIDPDLGGLKVIHPVVN